MSDLLITINSSASKRNGFIILETYYTKKVDSNKSGKFKGGSITAADIYNGMPVNNCELSFISEIFSEECIRVSENAYYVNALALSRIINKLSKYKMIFLDNPDKTLVLVSSVVSIMPAGKAKHQVSIDNLTLLWYADGSICISERENDINIVKQIVPVSHLQYSKEEQVYSLYFNYNGENIAYFTKNQSVRVGNLILLRNYLFEQKIVERSS